MSRKIKDTHLKICTEQVSERNHSQQHIARADNTQPHERTNATRTNTTFIRYAHQNSCRTMHTADSTHIHANAPPHAQTVHSHMNASPHRAQTTLTHATRKTPTHAAQATLTHAAQATFTHAAQAHLRTPCRGQRSNPHRSGSEHSREYSALRHKKHNFAIQKETPPNLFYPTVSLLKGELTY